MPDDDGTAEYFRQRAAQCRRLADNIINREDPVVVSSRTLAVEFEARASAIAATTRPGSANVAPDRTIEAVQRSGIKLSSPAFMMADGELGKWKRLVT